MEDSTLVFAQVFNYLISIMYDFFVFLFDDFYIFPPFYNVTLGYLLLGFLIFTLILRFFVAVPKTNGGGKRAKSSKKGSKSSSTNTSDS